jgi:hypothetical protein
MCSFRMWGAAGARQPCLGIAAWLAPARSPPVRAVALMCPLPPSYPAERLALLQLMNPDIGRMQIRYRRIECTPPEDMKVSVMDFVGSNGWLRLSIEVSPCLGHQHGPRGHVYRGSFAGELLAWQYGSSLARGSVLFSEAASGMHCITLQDFQVHGANTTYGTVPQSPAP